MAGFVLGMVVGVLINCVTALFSRKHALQLTPWLCLYVALHGGFLLLGTNYVWGHSVNLAQRYHHWWSYAIVITTFAIAGAVFWFCVQKATQKLGEATSQPHEAATQGPKDTSTKEAGGIKEHEQTKPNNPHPREDNKRPTMVELFSKDLPNTLKASDDTIGIGWDDGSVTKVKRQLYFDFSANAKFVGFYISNIDPLSTTKTMSACMILDNSNAVQQTLEDMPKKMAVSGGFGDQMTNIQDLRFSGRVLIYHEGFMSITQKADIIRAYAAKQYSVQFIGPEYLATQIIAWHHDHDAKRSKP
jgi:hypothetical protein